MMQCDLALEACANRPGDSPIYLRLQRGPEHVFNRGGMSFEIGRAIRLAQGNDVCLIAHGSTVFEAMLASDLLLAEGIAAEVLNMHSIKPIDREAILSAAARVRAMVVVEEHNVFGGLGSAVLEVLADGHAFPVRRLGVQDMYPPIGPTPELRDALGLSGPHIARAARDLVGGGRTP
jgi:transketolase